MTPELKEEIEKGLKSFWSPEQICGRYQLERKTMVAFKTIISDENLNKALGDLNHRPRKCLAYRIAFEALLKEFE